MENLRLFVNYKNTLKNEGISLKDLHEKYGFDLEADLKAILFEGAFTENSLNKAICLNDSVSFVLIKGPEDELDYCSFYSSESSLEPSRDYIKHANSLSTKGLISLKRKKHNKLVLVIAQKISLLKKRNENPKDLTRRLLKTEYKSWSDGTIDWIKGINDIGQTIKLTGYSYHSCSDFDFGNVKEIEKIIDKSGYLKEPFKEKLNNRLVDFERKNALEKVKNYPEKKSDLLKVNQKLSDIKNSVNSMMCDLVNAGKSGDIIKLSNRFDEFVDKANSFKTRQYINIKYYLDDLNYILRFNLKNDVAIYDENGEEISKGVYFSDDANYIKFSSIVDHLKAKYKDEYYSMDSIFEEAHKLEKIFKTVSISLNIDERI